MKNFWFFLLLSSFVLPIWAQPIAQDATALETENGSTPTSKQNSRLSWDTQKVLSTIENISFYAHALANAYCLFSYINIIPIMANSMKPPNGTPSFDPVYDMRRTPLVAKNIADTIESRGTQDEFGQYTENAIPTIPKASDLFCYSLVIHTFTSVLRLYLTRDKTKPFLGSTTKKDLLKNIIIKYPHFLGALGIGIDAITASYPIGKFIVGALTTIDLIVLPIHAIISGIKYCLFFKNQPLQKLNPGKDLKMDTITQTT
jgi:hypothetical protein